MMLPGTDTFKAPTVQVSEGGEVHGMARVDHSQVEYVQTTSLSDV